MSHAMRMQQTNPSPLPVDAIVLQACIVACFDCTQTCTACADACLGEQNPQMLTRCIRLNLDCADMCSTTGRIMSRQTAFDPLLARAALQACAIACGQCGSECQRHGEHGMEHCAICAEACRQCGIACTQALSALPAQAA